jgi:TetR/AcrR family transcriptional repressor of lmrAB and yxaGH operons
MLRQRGYRASGLTDLLHAAKATNGSLYHHFPGGKEELAEEAIRESGAEVEAALRFVLENADDPVAAVQAWIDAAIAALRADPRDGCPIAPTAIESASISDRLRHSAADAFDGWTGALEAALAHTRPAKAAHDQARAILATIEGALLLDRTAGSTTHLQAVRRVIPRLLAERPDAT